MSPILVTGGSGQLATAMARAGGDAVRVVGRPAFDFDRPESLDACLAAARPALIVNTAAWTAVDAAEAEPAAAARANCAGPARLAELCRDADIPFIHISTDYVFDGRKGAPYVETDPTGPTGVYGATTLAGEQAVLQACPRAIVLRTSWVYSATGKNFVRTMLKVAETRDRLRVVADQKGCPTAAADLAECIIGLAGRLADGWRDEYAGLFHAAGTGWTTWHGLAEAVFEEAARHGAKHPLVEAITTADYPTPAHRPADSRLDCDKLARVFGLRQPEWRGSLARTVADLLVPAAPGR
ncbi:MAG: dTDP-4-dehydrorhamnose reductase [Acetobacteraceae bacterium]